MKIKKLLPAVMGSIVKSDGHYVTAQHPCR